MTASTKKKAKAIQPEVIVIDQPLVAQEQDTGTKMLAVIEKASTDPRCNVDKMRALLDMQMELVRDERRLIFNNAMWEAQSEMTPIVRKAWNESTKSAFAKLEHVDNIVRPIYAKHGFSLRFTSKKEEDSSITMKVKVTHRSGHEDEAELNMEVDDKGPKGTQNKTRPQGVASTTSILQRKLTVMVFNLTFINDDDDGQGGKKEPKKDAFSDRVKKESLPLDAAADALIEKIKAQPSKEKRGELLMTNIKIMKALDDEGKTELAKTIRDLAEAEVIDA